MSVGIASRKGKQQDRCVLCGCLSKVDYFGKLFVDSSVGIAIHQYCMFFASGLSQNGEDAEGFDGFLVDDIATEMNRARKLVCSYCKKKGASIGCCHPKCKSKFHYKCGKDNGSLFQFCNSFNSYCRNHRPKQTDSVDSPSSHECPICLAAVRDTTCLESLKTPCCKNAWFHRDCFQKHALASGLYFFRCPVCNNMDEFQMEMKRMGIFIPEQDAIWEQGDAYAELLHRHNACDADKCKCKKGRTHSEDQGPWKICLCFVCGQHGTHLKCQGWRREPSEWLCDTCTRGLGVGVSTLRGAVGDHSCLVQSRGQSSSECTSEESTDALYTTSDGTVSTSDDDLPLTTWRRDKGLALKPNKQKVLRKRSPKANGSFCSKSQLKTTEKVMGHVQRNLWPADSDCGRSSGENNKTYQAPDFGSSDEDLQSWSDRKSTSSSPTPMGILAAAQDMFVRAISSFSSSTEKEKERGKEKEKERDTVQRSNKRRRLITPRKSVNTIVIKDTDSEDTSSEATIEVVFERNAQEVSAVGGVKEKGEDPEEADGCCITKVIRDGNIRGCLCRCSVHGHLHKKPLFKNERIAKFAPWLRGEDLNGLAGCSSTKPSQATTRGGSAAPTGSSTTVKASSSTENEAGSGVRDSLSICRQRTGIKRRRSRSAAGTPQRSTNDVYLTIPDSDDEPNSNGKSISKSCSSSGDHNCHNVDLTITTKTVNTTVTSVKTKSLDGKMPTSTTSIKETITSINTTTLTTSLSSPVDQTEQESSRDKTASNDVHTAFENSLKPAAKCNKNRHGSGAGCLERSLRKYYSGMENNSSDTHECVG